MRRICILFLQFIFISISFCEFSESKDKYINALVNHLNGLPDQPFVYEEAELIKALEISNNEYYMEIKAKALDQNNAFSKYQNCTGTLNEDGDSQILVKESQCTDFAENWTENLEELVTDVTTVDGPIQLENEVQTENMSTSGEQFIAVPRDRPAPCIGCATFVDPAATGVRELAGLGIRQLDRHEPNTRHALNNVLLVERQVQVVGGIRYIMTLTIDYDNCTTNESDGCNFQKTCRIAVLEKPWQKLPDGSKFRAIISNNCTDEWLFDENGVPEPNFNNQSNDIVNPTPEYDQTGGADDIVKAIHNNEVQAQPANEKTLTDKQIKEIEEQIIPNIKVNQPTENSNYAVSDATQVDTIAEVKSTNLEAVKPLIEQPSTQQPEQNKFIENLSEDKKKAIEELINFFDFAGYKDKDSHDDIIRMKRDYGLDLQMLNIAENYQGMKTKIKNAYFIHKLALAMVDHINEMDIEVKTRILKEVIGAEEEIENDQRYFYVQARVVVPCDKSECKNKEVNICNGIIDGSGEQPSVLYTVCNAETRKYLGNLKYIPKNDPVLLKFLKRALIKIDIESKIPYALRVRKILSASTQRISGTLTKITVEIEYTECFKSVPLFRRRNCTALENLGYKVCDIEVVERHWLKETKMTYICTDRSVDEIFVSDPKKSNVDDPKIREIVQEALHNLEVKSNRNNKQKLIEVKSVSTKQVAGLLTNIVFTVGYTACTSEYKDDVNTCQLLENEPLRSCSVEAWERAWLDESRQLNITCEELNSGIDNKAHNKLSRKERSIQTTANEIEKDPNEYSKLADDCLTNYLVTYGISQHYKVVKIDKAVKVNVSGDLTKIDFEAAPTNCAVKNGYAISSPCKVQDSEETLSCHADVWAKPELNSRIMNVNCQVNENKFRRKRETLIGGLTIQDPNNPRYKELAEKSLTKYVLKTRKSKYHKVVTIQEVSTQVVSGIKTKILFNASPTNCEVDRRGKPLAKLCVIEDPNVVLRCSVEIWEQPWVGREEKDVTCHPDKPRGKRDLPGGIVSEDTSNPKYMQLAEESLAKYVSSSGCTDQHKIIEIKKVNKQVVSGTKTIIDFTVQEPAGVLECHSEVWEQLWLKNKEITVNCVPSISRQKRQLPGGVVEQDRNNPEFLQLAKESLAKYVASIGSAEEHKILEIEKVTSQTVAGTMTRIYFKVQSPSEALQCQSDIWEQAWLHSKEITVRCAPINLRQKRHLRGGLLERDPKDPKYTQLAEESLANYVSSIGSTDQHKIIEIKKVNTQVVSGTKTIIDFTVQEPAGVLECHSEVWEQPWLNKKEITVHCVPTVSRKKRQLPGGPLEKDPKDPKYTQLAEESLAKYVSSTGSTQQHKVIEVKKVNTQVVSGRKTIIDFTVQGPSGVLECHSEVWEQSWLKTKDITVNCVPTISRQKRQLLGGLSEKDPKDPEYTQLAKESLAKYVSSTGSTEEHKIIEIKKVNTQVVSGTKTIIDFTVQGPADVLECHSEVWEQSWLKKKEITVHCVPTISRKKRQLPGGPLEKDPKDPKYTQLAEESLAKYVSSTGSTEQHKIIEIKTVKTQVVSGKKTIIEFTVQGPAEVLECHSEIWEQPWLKTKEITVNCVPSVSRQKRQLPGGPLEKDPKDPEYTQLAKESLAKYVSSTGSTEEHNIIEIKKVNTQVVSGIKTIIDFTVQGPTGVLECHSEVWEQSWLKKKEITVQCVPTISRKKRQLPGGPLEKDPKDPKYTQLAEESLAKYVSSTGSTEQHKIIEIKTVKTQVVSGKKTIIEFTVQGPAEVLECHSEIWEQPWLKTKEITVNCVPSVSRQKRQLPGGPLEKDPKDPKYTQLAKESLAKYVSSTGSTEEHNIIEIKKVNTQVVSGIKTIIDFTVQGPTGVLECHSEVWEQSWLKKKEITVQCVPTISRKKRQLPGGPLEKDPKDPEYTQLAKESLAKYVSSTGSTEEHNIIEIKKVNTQVVSGKKTIIEFTVQGPAGVLECQSEVWEQSWLKKKEITVQCVPTISRKKRQLPGGSLEKDPKDPKYTQLAEDSLAKYVSSTGSTEQHKIIEIKTVKTQVVSGKKTIIEFTVQGPAEILECHSEIWEQPWLKRKEITVNCVPKISRQKRQLLGGLSEKDPKDPKYTQLAEESLSKYVYSTGSTEQHKIIEIKKVNKQVVSGTKTIIDFTVQGPASVLECHSEIWEQHWLKKKEITVNCSPAQSRKRRDVQLVSAVRNLNRFQNSINSADRKSGGRKEEDPTKPKYAALAVEALRKYEKLNKCEFLHKVIRVDHVVTQVVSGQKIFMDFTSAPTTCASNVSEETLCDIITTTTLYCRAEIWNRPWIKRKKIDVFCNDDHEEIDSQENKRKKRSLYNVSDLDIKDFDDSPEKTATPVEVVNEDSEKETRESYILKYNFYNSKHYLKAAEESLREYEIISKSDIVYKVVKIHYVNEEDDVGVRLRLDFSASPSNCSKTNNTNTVYCGFVEPKELISCHADIRLTMLLDNNLVKNHKVECSQRKRKKSNVGDIERVRNKRQISIDENVEDDLMFYYADQVMSKLNSRFVGDNLYKLITVHDVRRTIHMKTPLVRMYLEVGKTYCLRSDPITELSTCNEIEGLTHILCYARLWPSIYDDIVIERTDAVCEDEIRKFVPLAGFHTSDLLAASLLVLNRDGSFPNFHRSVGKTYVIPTLDYNKPIRLSFIVAGTNCSKEYVSTLDPTTRAILNECFTHLNDMAKQCHSQIYMSPNSRTLRYVNVSCTGNIRGRTRRSISLNPKNITEEDLTIQKYVQEALQQLEMVSVLRYKQRVLVINRYSSKTTTLKQTTIDFDVGYTNCLKYEWVDNITSCEFLEHLPRRHCVAVVSEKLWSDNSRQIEVNCDDDETPLEANMELETAQAATNLAKEALKRIEYKYPHPRRQIVVRIFSLEKQMVAGIHYRMKLEVGYSTCMALSESENCKLDPLIDQRKFCRVNVWLRSWTNHPPSYRVTCDYHDGAVTEIFHQMQAQELFAHFMVTHKPSYIDDHDEMQKRFVIFKQNVKKIHELNVYEMGTARYAVTQTADLTLEEFKKKFLGLDPKLRDENQVPMPEAEIPAVSLPDSFDWRDQDAVTEVKNQGGCGSCWAFSVTGNIEGQWKRHSGKLVSLSEQELVDCDKLDKGCNGGLPDNAYRAIEQLGGLEMESDYPYEGEDDKCAYNATLSRVQISGAVNISSNETDMAKWLVKNGPISIGINANAMQFYVGGISHPWKMLCNPSNLDHGVLIVGYGMKDYPLFKKKLPYWIVKNSWGPTWGEQGYYRVYRGDGTCGVNQMASSAVI